MENMLTDCNAGKQTSNIVHIRLEDGLEVSTIGVCKVHVDLWDRKVSLCDKLFD